MYPCSLDVCILLCFCKNGVEGDTELVPTQCTVNTVFATDTASSPPGCGGHVDAHLRLTQCSLSHATST